MAMVSFPSKVAPSSAKLRGGYYTPEPIATFLARWVGATGGRVLEPSCGELDQVEAAKAREQHPGAQVIDDDFFTWFDQEQRNAWDGVVGNPPFIRFQHWTEPTRSLAFDVMRSIGMQPTKLTNAWVPFVVSSSLALRKGGRLGLVVPAEIMQVNYASELRALLVDEFAELTVVTFTRLLFAGILQEVVLLLGVRGTGPAKIKVVEVRDADALPAPEVLTSAPHAPALRHEREKWTKYFLGPTEIKALRSVLERKRLPRLGDIAEVDVGVVTGRNQRSTTSRAICGRS
jgi:adenine-specific DNA methylase